jgi:hypothetical protein
MLKYRRKLLTGAAAAAAAATIAVTGITAATADQRTAPAASGTEHFQIMTTSATSKGSSIIAHGMFTAGGTTVSGNGSTSTVKFANGTFQINHSKGTGSKSFNPKTCLATINLTGTYTLLNGTGAYTNISGHGTYQLSILAVGAKSGGKCSKTLPPPTFQQVIKASGPVSLP